jgi:ATP-binding cassette subfamily B protein
VLRNTSCARSPSKARGALLGERAHEVFRSTMWVLATNSLTRGITDTGIAVGAAATLAVGAYRVAEGETSIAVLLMVLMAGVETFRPQRDLRTLLHDGMVGLSAAEGIFELMEAKPVVRWEGTTSSTVDASVRFEQVSFESVSLAPVARASPPLSNCCCAFMTPAAAAY